MNQSACPVIGKWNRRAGVAEGGLWGVGGWLRVGPEGQSQVPLSFTLNVNREVTSLGVVP